MSHNIPTFESILYLKSSIQNVTKLVTDYFFKVTFTFTFRVFSRRFYPKRSNYGNTGYNHLVMVIVVKDIHTLL